ncbi:protein kinase [bacterium]|nr:protein kinase [bacterium]
MASDKPRDTEHEKTIGASQLDTREQLTQAQRPTHRQSPELVEGQLFGSYRLIRLLGKGGFGQVWEAEGVENGRKLAIKVLTEVTFLSTNIVDRFQQEGRLAASINHPNCVYIFGAEEIDGYPAITMELMPGGTLQDLLNQGKDFTVKEAIDYTLSLIDGLEAAQLAGIIHRDIKPSNCFLDENGNIKIGDFGLSKTLESDTKLTVTGTFLGTPSYASPEQIRGQDLDFRSDLYSLAATLYAILSGAPPFEGKHAAEVLARIVADPPPPLRQKRSDVPGGLEKVILRALSKNPAMRYSSYSALRAVLLPYSSTGLKVSSLGKRFLAHIIDLIILFPFGLLAGLWSMSAHQYSFLNPVLTFLYFFLFEKLWGRTPGKQLFRLRVVSNQGTPLSWNAAFFRTIFFVLITSVLPFAKLILPASQTSDAVFSAGWIAILATMRRRNGFAGLHEILSKTRVMAVPEKNRISVPHLPPSIQRKVSQMFGPYRATTLLWENQNEQLFAGHDEILKRDVWIHAYTAEDQPLKADHLSVFRSGRLRWIQGHRKQDGNWDVFEVPGGTGFREWVESKGKLSWPEVRSVMEGSAAELEALFQDQHFSKQISLHHLWVDGFGNTKLLDFPISLPQESGTTTTERWKDFLHQVLLFGLTGKVVSFESLNGRTPQVPAPESSRRFIQRLCREKNYESPRTVHEELQQLTGPAEINRWKRFATLSLPIFPFLILIIGIGLFVLLMPVWLLDLTNAGEHLKTLNGLQDPKRTEAIEKTLAYCYSEYLKFSSSPSMYELRLEPAEKSQLESILRKHPRVTIEEYQEARQIADLKPAVFKLFSGERKPTDRPWHTYVFPVVTGISFFSFFSIPIAFLLRRPFLFTLMGISLQTIQGERVGHFRSFFRSFLSWLPVLMFNPGIMEFVSVRPPAGIYFYSGFIALTLAGIVYAIVYPHRSLQDRIAGTVLVPA